MSVRIQHTHNPICRTCGYDLTGVIDADNLATCPECGNTSDSLRNTLPISRWPALKRLIPAHIGLMFATCLILLLPSGNVGLMIWLMLQLLVLPAALLLIENNLRIAKPSQGYTPTMMQVSVIVIIYTFWFFLVELLVMMVLVVAL